MQLILVITYYIYFFLYCFLEIEMEIATASFNLSSFLPALLIYYLNPVGYALYDTMDFRLSEVFTVS